MLFMLIIVSGYQKSTGSRVVQVIKALPQTTVGYASGSGGKDSALTAGDPEFDPCVGRPPGEGNGNPLQYFCLEKYMDRGAWQATVHGVAKNQTQLSD